MKLYRTIRKDSKGNEMNYLVQKYDNKQTLGLRKHFGNKKDLNDLQTKLLVHGNFDSLKRIMDFNKTQTTKEHPTDKGYFKKVFVLSTQGKIKLLNKKRKSQSK